MSEPALPRDDFDGARVLVVQDDPGIARMLALMFEREGFPCDCVWDGEEAVSLILERDYDVLLMDGGLPGIHGLEVIRRVREAGAMAPIIYFESAGLGDGAAALALGAAWKTHYPFRFDTVMTVARRLIADYRREVNWAGAFDPSPETAHSMGSNL